MHKAFHFFFFFIIIACTLINGRVQQKLNVTPHEAAATTTN